MTAGGDWGCNDEEMRKQILSAVKTRTELGRYSVKHYETDQGQADEFILKIDLKKEPMSFNPRLYGGVEVGREIEEELNTNFSTIRLPISTSLDHYLFERAAYMIGDSAVVLAYNNTEVSLSVYNEYPEKREATIKSLDRILI